MKILISLVGLILLAGVVIVTWLIFFFDANQYKEQLRAIVYEQTGRELILNGDLNLSFFPRIGVRAEDVGLGSSPYFPGASMLDLEEAEAYVQVAPLLEGDIRIDHITLLRPRVHLGIDEQGRSAWSDIVELNRSRIQQAANLSDEQALGVGTAALALQGLTIVNGELDWNDMQNGRSVTVSELSVELKRLEHMKPSDFDIRAALSGDGLPGRVDVQLKGSLRVDLNTFDFELSGLEARGRTGDFSASVDTGLIKIGDLAGPIRVTASDTGVELAMAGQSMEGRIPLLVFESSQQKIEVPGLVLETDGLRADAELDITGLDRTPTLEGAIRAQDMELVKLLALAGVDTDLIRKEALSPAGFGAEFRLQSGKLEVPDFDFKAGRNDLNGQLSVSNFAMPRIDAVLAGTLIDVDGLLAPPVSETTVVAAAPFVVPIQVLRKMLGSIRLNVDFLKSGGVEFEQLKLNVAADEKAVYLNRFDARVFDGAVSARASVSKDHSPVLLVEARVDDADAGQLLEKLEVTNRLAGRGTVSANLRSNGLNADQIVRTLDGNVAVALRDGMIRGIDIGKILQQAKDAVEGADKTAGTRQAEPETRFSSLDATAQIDQGMILNNDLLLKAPAFRVLGRGKADLPGNIIDYRLNINLAKTSRGQGGREVEQLKTLAIPVRLTGALDTPAITLDLESLLSAEADRRLEQERVKLESKLDQGLTKKRDKLEDKLRLKLFEALE